MIRIEDPQLTVEMAVPSGVIGRLIGKGGSNIREIQRQHFCWIKFLTEPDLSIAPPCLGETYCRITGTSNAFLFAQQKIRSLIVTALNKVHSRTDTSQSSLDIPVEEVLKEDVAS